MRRVAGLGALLAVLVMGCPDTKTSGAGGTTGGTEADAQADDAVGTGGAEDAQAEDAAGGGEDGGSTGGVNDAGSTGGGEDSSATGGDGDATSTGADVPVVVTPTCEAYCDLMDTNCAGDDAQYADQAACLAYCETAAQLPVGSLADTEGNTVGCRMYHAQVAAQGDAATHCGHAGPSGGDVCGSWCENYCWLETANCVGDVGLFEDDAACMTACGGFADTGAIGDVSGDTVQCRIYHLGVAGADKENGSAAAHCPHGAIDGGEVCVDTPEPTCTAYCALVMGTCTGDSAQYTSEAACLEYCQTWAALPLGTVDDTAGNTVGCRMYHAQVASESAEAAGTHCAHAGPSGGDVCGSWCDNYCALATKNCGGDGGLFVDDAECAAACDAYPVGSDALATDGDSVQCRIYHLGVAGSNPPDSTGAHCAHGNPTGGSDEGGFACVDVVALACEPLATPLECGDSLVGLSNGMAGSTTLMSSYACQLFASDDYGPSPELAWRFMSAVAQQVTVSKTAAGLSTIDLVVLKDEGDGCVSTETGCVDSSASAVTFEAEAGVEYFVIADSYDGNTESFDLSVSCCVPSCDGKMCGDDGCGGSCGVCADGSSCDDAGQCVENPLPVADDCASAGILGTTMPETVTGDTTWNTDTYSYGDGACPGQIQGAGGGAPDQVWTVTAATDGVYTVVLEADFDSALYVAGDCADVDGTCDGADDAIGSGTAETVSMVLAAGDSRSVIVDGWGLSERGTYALTVSAKVPEATPSCAYYCAVLTQACTGGNAQYESEEACLAYCETDGKLPIGESSDTSGNSVGCRTYHAGVALTGDAAVHCPHAGASGANVCGSWCENYCQLATDNCVDANALDFGAADCMTACAGFADTGDAGATTGDTVQCRIYHLGVAGNVDAGGPAVHCAHGALDGGEVCVDPPTDGDSCEVPFVVDALPYSHTGATDAYTNATSSGCVSGYGGMGSADNVFSFTPAADGTFVATLTADFDTILYMATDCTGEAASCLKHEDLSFQDGGELLSFEGTAGTTVFVVVDGWGDFSNQTGSYTLNIVEDIPALDCAYYCDKVSFACTGDNAQYASEAACMAYCQGAAAFAAGALGDTDGNTLGCRIYHAGVAATTAPEVHCAHAGPSGGDVCGSWCDNYCDLAMTNCAGTTDALYADAAGCQTACAGFPADALPGATGGDSVQCRIYHLGVAGSDPAGGSAAVHCPHGSADGGGVCVVPPGDSCETAFGIDALPFQQSGTTVGAASDYANGCVAGSFNGGASSDEVYAFTAAADGQIQITLEADYDAMLYVVTGCGGAAEACLDDSDEVGIGATESVTLAVAAGTTYSIIVDGYSGSSDIAGAYTLSVIEVPDPNAPELTCDFYCGAVMAACQGDNAEYADQQACLDYCATYGAFAAGALGDTGGDTLGCRIYHAGVALTTDAAVHCGHAGPTGGGVCGSLCENYCDLAAQNCTGANALWADNAACMAGCAAFAADGAPGDTDGDTLQCRLYHLGVAGNAAAGGAAIHCPHGGADGGGVCVAATGESCGAPTVIDALPFVMSGDTTGATSDYGYGGCDNGLLADGSASSDEVYTLTLDADAQIEITLSGQYDSALYVLTDCGAGTCVGYAEKPAGAQEKVLLDAVANTTYYIVVDGWDDIDNVAGAYQLNVDTVGASAFAVDGMVIQQTSSSKSFELPAGTMVEPGDYIVVGRNATQAEFETYWEVTLGANVHYFNAGNSFPSINGAETYSLQAPADQGGAVFDGPSISMSSGTNIQRLEPITAADQASSWAVGGNAPGAGPTPGSGQTGGTGIYISEVSDASGTGNFVYEFVELYVAGEPSAAPPAVTFDDVFPIFTQSCSACHGGSGLGGHNIAGPDKGVAWADAQKMSSACMGKTVGECAVIRANNESMPLTPTKVSAADKAKLQAWLDDGLQGPQ